MKKRLLFVITQFYKGGAETSLLNLFKLLNPEKYEVDFIVLNQIVYPDATSLMELIPKWIQVYDVLEQGSNYKIIDQYIVPMIQNPGEISFRVPIATKLDSSAISSTVISGKLAFI